MLDSHIEDLPPLRSQRSHFNPLVYCRYFSPDCSRSWLVIEGTRFEDDFCFFCCMLNGRQQRWGTILLSELSRFRGPMGMPVERDTRFVPRPLRRVAGN